MVKPFTLNHKSSKLSLNLASLEATILPVSFTGWALQKISMHFTIITSIPITPKTLTIYSHHYLKPTESRLSVTSPALTGSSRSSSFWSSLQHVTKLISWSFFLKCSSSFGFCALAYLPHPFLLHLFASLTAYSYTYGSPLPGLPWISLCSPLSSSSKVSKVSSMQRSPGSLSWPWPCSQVPATFPTAW